MAVSLFKSPAAQIQLIPWDPESPDHVERMTQQRIACGWKHDKIEGYRELQREGKVTLQWVVLADEDPEREKKLEKHLTAYPVESGFLVDSATSLGRKTRTPPALQKTFIPVGHIALNTECESVNFRGDDREGLYWISTFYISHALQNCGLGRAAMDVVENTATAEPLCAKTLALSTLAASELHSTKLKWDIKLKWDMMGIEPPKVVNQEWYARRGYEVYRTVPQMWQEIDKEGKIWFIPAVFMKKDIV